MGGGHNFDWKTFWDLNPEWSGLRLDSRRKSGTWWGRHAFRCKNNPLQLSKTTMSIRTQKRPCFVRFSQRRLFPYTAFNLMVSVMWTQCFLWGTHWSFTSFGRISKAANLLTAIFFHKSGSLDRTLFLGAFAKLRKAAISIVMSVSPSDHMEQLASN